ncbi:hypothetical protein Emed_004733 [Eimeria media]
MARATTVEEVQCLLQKCGKSGHNVYDHLTDLVAALVAEQPEDPYEAFERVSESVKAQKDIKQKPTTAAAAAAAAAAADTAAAAAAAADADAAAAAQSTTRAAALDAVEGWVKTTKRLLSTADPTKDADISASCPDFLEENRLLNWAGTGFSQVEAFRICCALKRLASSSPGIASVRFWGKILGIERDYIIAETRFEGEEPVREDQETEETMDRRGTGANTFTYFVLQENGTKWALLPDVLPCHIATARKIKKLFTGNLDRQVISFPWFPGRERHLLRAMIAIISSETVLCPAGLLQAPEEGAEAEEDPDFEFPPAKALATIDAWTHARAHLTQSGLSSYPELDEEDENYAKLQQQMEEDPILEVTRSLKTDADLADGRPAWIVRFAGDTATYKETSHGIVAVLSNSWPGAVTVCCNKVFSSIYCGWGIKHGGDPFFPIAPQDVQTDPPDLEEQPEPQPGDEELSDGASHDDEEEPQDEGEKEEGGEDSAEEEEG